MHRVARVAGRFYDQNPKKLRQDLENLWPKPLPQAFPCQGALVPHAGYVYSGKVAAEVFARLEPRYLYSIGDRPHGQGSSVSVAPEGTWGRPWEPCP